jgi:O-antigen ligase
LAAVIALKIMAGYVAAITVGARLDTIALFEGTFSNRRVSGQVASMAIPLLAYSLLTSGMPRAWRWSVFALLAVWWMLVIVSGTRGTWMALAAAAVVLAAVAWRASSGWLRIQTWALGAGALLFAVLFVGLPAWLGLDASLENRFVNLATLSGRGVLWTLAWDQIQAHPWLGIGPMHLASIRNDYGAHPHNAVLQLAAEWGVPAALALIVPAVVGLFYLLARLRRQETSSDALLVCLTASLLAASAQSMVDGVIVIPYTQTWLVLVAGWTLGVYFRGGAPTPAIPDSRMTRPGIPVLSLLALAALLNGVFPEVSNRVEVTQAYVDAEKPILPRYWGVGWIP